MLARRPFAVVDRTLGFGLADEQAERIPADRVTDAA